MLGDVVAGLSSLDGVYQEESAWNATRNFPDGRRRGLLTDHISETG